MSLPLPVASLVTLLSTGSVVVRSRMSPSVNALGERVPSAYVDRVVSPAVVHPASEAALEQIPVADRVNEHVEVYTREPVYTAQGNRAAEEVYWDGAWYKLVTVSSYQAQGAVYFGMASRMKPGDAP